MIKLGLLFPGQGSQSVGMGYSLVSRFPDFEPFFYETLREADSTLGFALSGIIKDGPAEKLKETDITQPALLTISTALGRWLKSKGIHGVVALGHSLGEYSALVHAEAFHFRDAVKLVQLRGQLMQSAVASGVGGMAALVGATPEAARKLCEDTLAELPGKVLEPSAFNSPGQVVVSGHMEAIDLAVTKSKNLGLRAAKLEVSGPFHCSLLKPAGDKLRPALQSTQISVPSIPVVANTSARIQQRPEEIRVNLEKQVSQAVRWEESVKAAAESYQVKNFIEVGSAKVLSGLMRKILPEAKVLALDNLEKLEDLSQFTKA